MKKKALVITLTLVLLLSMTSFAFADEKLPPAGGPFSAFSVPVHVDKE